MATPAFLGLPPELRCMIYDFYLPLHDGYHYDMEAGKLRAANGELIHLALTRVCKLVASELNGLALEKNTITFSSGYRPLLVRRARSFQALYPSLCSWQRRKLSEIGFCINDSIYEQLNREFPGYTTMLNAIRNNDTHALAAEEGWGYTLSTHRRFISKLMWHLSNLPNIRGTEEPSKTLEIMSDPALNIPPWIIPERKTLLVMRRLIGSPKVRAWREGAGTSATSMAIAFLSALPARSRSHIRRISLLEESRSEFHSPCHPHGLIPFCQENPNLRIVSRLDYWGNTVCPFLFLPVNPYCTSVLEGCLASHALAAFISEAHSLTAAGMPPGSFKLILDDGEATRGNIRTFERVIYPHMARLSMLKSLNHQAIWLRRSDEEDLKLLPQALRDIQSNMDPIITCTFDMGNPMIVDEIKKRFTTWTGDDWENKRIPLPPLTPP